MVGNAMSDPDDPNGAVTAVSRQRITALYPGIRPLAYRILQDVYAQTNRRLNVVQGMRSMDDQLVAYSLGRQMLAGRWQITDAKQIVTNAKPGLSWHCYGLAFDCAWQGTDPYLDAESQATREQLWASYGAIVGGHGMTWGGGFRLVNGVEDKPHAEMAYGLSIDQALELYEAGGVSAVWAHCDFIRGVPQGSGWTGTSPGLPQ